MTVTAGRNPPKPWSIHFFQRDKADDADRTVPAMAFLDSIPTKVAAKIHAVLDAVAAAPPPSFSGGGKWEAMHDDMAGYFEIRVQGGGMNHRLFCILERDAEDLGGSSIVCLDGLSKPPRTAAHPRDYQRVKRYGAEFQKRRTVLE
jgi:Txe/YoeB family toxin of Txe-Axe toxin-antitoxin module